MKINCDVKNIEDVKICEFLIGENSKFRYKNLKRRNFIEFVANTEGK